MSPGAETPGETDRGIVLFNLGGPETLADVRPFLYNLFSDPDIIRIRSGLLRKTLAWTIAATRQFKSRDLYRQIGGGSPLRRITEDQAAVLEKTLAARGARARVYVAMRCWQPTIDQAVDSIAADRIRKVVALPLFPQYSVTTTGSCFGYFRKALAARGLDRRVEVSWIDSWYDDPLYLDAMAETVRGAAARFPDPDPSSIRLLYSAHSIPARYVAEGDPYLEQTRATMRHIDELLEGRYRSVLAFQSKVGPVAWLEPATRDVLQELGREGVRRVLVVPISFVSDHIETLQEIDILYRNLARSAGIAEFERAASLNLHPKFIEALARLALGKLENHGRAGA
jgi:ferrochelatase